MLMKKLITAGVTACAVTLSGCASNNMLWTANQQYIIPPVKEASPMEKALSCAASNKPAGFSTTLGVTQVMDITRAGDFDGLTSYLPTNANYLLIDSLHKAGFAQVQRQAEAMNVMEWEFGQALAKYLGDSSPQAMPAGKMGTTSVPYRLIKAGELAGSDMMVSGAITSLDFDTASGGAMVEVNGYALGKRKFASTIGMNVVLADTHNGKIVWSDRYAKTLIGYETKAGAFRFVDTDTLIDIQIGNQTQEGMQSSLRYMADLIAYDIAKDLYGIGSVCDGNLPVIEDRNIIQPEKKIRKKKTFQI